MFVNRLCILDTFAGLPLLYFMDIGANVIPVLEAGTFKLKARYNAIGVYSNGLHAVQPGTFVLPGSVKPAAECCVKGKVV